MKQIIRFRFDGDQSILLEGVDHEIVEQTSSYVKLKEKKVGEAREHTLSHSQLHDLLKKRGTKLRQQSATAAIALARKNRSEAIFNNLGDRTKEDALMRFDYCFRYKDIEDANLRIFKISAFSRKGRSDNKMRPIIDKIHLDREEHANEVAKRSKPSLSGPAPNKIYKARCGRRRSKHAVANVGYRPSPSTLRGWLRIYEEHDRATALLLLADNYDNCGRHADYPPDLLKLMHKHALNYMKDTEPSYKSVHEDLQKAVDDYNRSRSNDQPELKTPHERTFTNYIKGFGAYAIMLGRKGEAYARSKFWVSVDKLKIQRPLQHVQMDDWTVDLHVLLIEAGIWDELTKEEKAEVQRARFQLCVIMDVRTRVILAMSLARTSSVENALTAIEMAMYDKTHLAKTAGAQSTWHHYGRPELFTFDNGGNFISRDTLAKIHLAGCDYQIMPAGLPELRGHIERLFKTFQSRLISNFHGQTFSNFLIKKEYDSAKRASITADEFADLLVIYVCDVYHNTPHEGLNFQTPANCWNELVAQYGLTPAPNIDEMRDIFGLEVDRVISDAGVSILGLWYQGLELQEYRRQHGNNTRVKVRFSKMDLHSVSVELGANWYTYDCDDPISVGLTYDEWRKTLASLKERNLAQAELTRRVLEDALAYIRQFGSFAGRRAGIRLNLVTPNDIRSAEERLLMSFRLPSADTQLSVSSSPLADALPLTGSAPEQGAVGASRGLTPAVRMSNQPPIVPSDDLGPTPSSKAPSSAGELPSGPPTSTRVKFKGL